MPIALQHFPKLEFDHHRDAAGELICICVYKRGALEVARRLAFDSTSSAYYLRENPPEISREPVRALPEAGRKGE